MNAYKVYIEKANGLVYKIVVDADSRGKAYRAAADRFPGFEILSIVIVK